MRSTTALSRLFIGSLALAGCGGDDSVSAADTAARREIGLLTADTAVATGAPADSIDELPWTETPMVMRVSDPFFGDWDAIRERGVLRVLVSYSRTNFFLSEGRLRGFEYEMFNELQQQLAKQPSAGHPPLQVAYFPVPFDELLKLAYAARGLHIEDLFELVHSGAFEYTVADRFMAELWSSVLDDIRIESDYLLGTGGELAWAVRRSSPELKGRLDEFISANKRGSLIGNVLFKRTTAVRSGSRILSWTSSAASSVHSSNPCSVTAQSSASTGA